MSTVTALDSFVTFHSSRPAMMRVHTVDYGCANNAYWNAFAMSVAEAEMLDYADDDCASHAMGWAKICDCYCCYCCCCDNDRNRCGNFDAYPVSMRGVDDLYHKIDLVFAYDECDAVVDYMPFVYLLKRTEIRHDK